MMNPVDRERRFTILKATPCLCCAMMGLVTMQVDIHHLNENDQAGAERLGDEYTIPLCRWHHTGEVPDGMSMRAVAAMRGPSFARESTRFREVFGSGFALLETANLIVARRLQLRVA